MRERSKPKNTEDWTCRYCRDEEDQASILNSGFSNFCWKCNTHKGTCKGKTKSELERIAGMDPSSRGGRPESDSPSPERTPSSGGKKGGGKGGGKGKAKNNNDRENGKGKGPNNDTNNGQNPTGNGSDHRLAMLSGENTRLQAEVDRLKSAQAVLPPAEAQKVQSEYEKLGASPAKGEDESNDTEDLQALRKEKRDLEATLSSLGNANTSSLFVQSRVDFQKRLDEVVQKNQRQY